MDKICVKEGSFWQDFLVLEQDSVPIEPGPGISMPIVTMDVHDSAVKGSKKVLSYTSTFSAGHYPLEITPEDTLKLGHGTFYTDIRVEFINGDVFFSPLIILEILPTKTRA